jgi:non-heme chloroperoxidase
MKMLLEDINVGFYIRVENNIKVYVEDINSGSRKTVFFVHGWPGNHNLFEYQFNYLPKMGLQMHRDRL